jgi:RNA polymerase-binding transcription factor
MTKRQEKRFRRDLETTRGDLVRQLRLRRETLAVDDGGDRMDRVCRMEERNSTTKDVSRLTELLHSVEEALERLNEGSFGTCADCGRDLPAKRLEIVPWARLCVSCKESREGWGRSRTVGLAS